MKKISKFAALLLLPFAAGAVNFPVGTHLVKGTLKDWQNKVLTSSAAVTIRRHSTLRAGNDFTSTRLVGRSVWNDKWLIVIPASSLNSDRTRALDTFINGVGDIKIGIRAYSRQGN